MAAHYPRVMTVPIASVTEGVATSESDELSVEEPLEIQVSAAGEGSPVPLAVTMRTPGDDGVLAAGFLFTEGIVRDRAEIADLRPLADNIILATLNSKVRLDAARFERHSYVSSSCGVCGKRSIAAVLALKRHAIRAGSPQIESQVIDGLPRTQREAQATFQRTGGLHAAALFDSQGNLLALYEDVGRHNALDKLIGSELLAGRIPLADRIVFLSGRASFELIQKASMAGIPVVASVGAPSTLAVALARESSMTLLGFVRDGRFNVYADAGRLAETPAELFPTADSARSSMLKTE
jgi:FdhD protein